jgi:hypothetical protein
MTWLPTWVYGMFFLGVIPYVILSPLYHREANLRTPLCDRHKHHWLVRNMWIALGMLGYVLSILGCPISFAMLSKPLQGSLGVLVFIGYTCLLIGSIALIAVSHHKAIHPTEITHTHLVLEGVSERFIQAVMEQDHGPEREFVEPQSAPPSDGIEAHKPGLPRSDAFEE